MYFPAGDWHSVAPDHHGRIANRRTRRFFRDRKDHHRSALFSILRETLRRQPLTRFRPLDVFIRNSLPLLPAFIKNCRLQRRASCRVRITFRGYVQASRARSLDHRKQCRRISQPHARNVYNMQRRSGGYRVGDYFLQSY